MSESVIAEFPARVVCKSRDLDGPIDVRVRLDRTHLTIQTDEHELSAPVSAVFDVTRDRPPLPAEDEFDGPMLTVAFHRGLESEVVFFEGDPDHLDRFRYLLFKVVLDGTDVVVRHPAEIGGRATGTSPQRGTVFLGRRAVEFADLDLPFEIDLESIVDFTTRNREVEGREFPVVAIEFVRNASAIISEVALGPSRKFNLFGRFLRTEYASVREALSAIDLSATDEAVLRRLYSVGGQTGVRTLLGDRDRSSLRTIESLRDRRLVEGEDGQIALTPRGWILVTDTLQAWTPRSADVKPP